MVNKLEPEFSFIVHPSELVDVEKKFELTAESDERAALSKRFGLKAIDAFNLIVKIKPLREKNAIRLRGQLYASVIQSCIVSLVPIKNTVEEEFEIIFREENQIDRTGSEDIDELESYFDDTIDIGEIASGELALAIDQYPRAPGISDEVVEPYLRKQDDLKTKPFGGLAALKRKK
jgi:uncharacterized metal-binding protein YceD (DUF177 family)